MRGPERRPQMLAAGVAPSGRRGGPDGRATLRRRFPRKLTARYGADDEEWLRAGYNCLGKWCVQRLVRQILLAREKAYIGASFIRGMVANSALQHRVTSLNSVQERTHRWASGEIDFDVAADVRQRPQMRRQYDCNHRKEEPAFSLCLQNSMDFKINSQAQHKSRSAAQG